MTQNMVAISREVLKNFEEVKKLPNYGSFIGLRISE